MNSPSDSSSNRELGIEVAATPTPAPASLLQQRWMRYGLDRAGPNDTLISAHRLRGLLDVAALEQSFNQMIQRQPVLRTVIKSENGRLVQQVLPSLQIRLALEDLSTLEPLACEPALQAALELHIDEAIDLRTPPLFKLALYRLSNEEHVLFFAPHRAIWDSRSFDLFREEMTGLYAAYGQGREPEPLTFSSSYVEFSHWQERWLHGNEAKGQLAYWKTTLTDPPEPIDLPSDRPRPLRMSGQSKARPLALSTAQTDALRRMGRDADATLFETLVAVYAAFLSRSCGQPEVIIGTTGGRRPIPAVESLMGCFANSIPLRLRSVPQTTISELVMQAREVVRSALPNQDMPLEHLIRELKIDSDESRPILAQASFDLQTASLGEALWGELRVQQVAIDRPRVTHDLELWFQEGAQGLRGGLAFNADVCTDETAARMGKRFELLLAAALASPDVPIGRLPFTSHEERNALLRWNDTNEPFDSTDTVCALIGRQASLTPSAAALRVAGTHLNYAELESRANQLAQYLRCTGIGRGNLVGLHLERSADMVVAQLAILKAGAAYVPLDPAYPPDRLAYMAKDAQLTLIVTSSALGRAPQQACSKVLLLDSDAAAIAGQPATALVPDAARDARPEDPAYVIYTSGSTGKPKGVMVHHRAVVNFLASMARAPGLAATDRMLAVTTLSFDIAVLEVLLPLSVGAEVVLALRDAAVDGRALRVLLESSGATMMQATPATWRLLIDAGWRGGPKFRALIGGEALAVDLAYQLLERTGALWNMYGPTETTVWSTCWKVVQPGTGISIGRPIANTQVYVLDEQQQICPIGVPGEIYIGGEGVTLGYLNRPELTAERFIAYPTSSTHGGKLYRTGDRGRWRHDGQIEHMGRLDFQVKVRGYRIELGEIESNLVQHPQVAHTVVMAREDRPADVRLAAYFVAKNGMPAAAALREYLRMRLPEYMVPQHFIALDAIPTLPNGKVDRKALPAPTEGEHSGGAAYLAPRSEAEAMIAEIWQRLLNIEQVSAADNFFDLGGHSLLAMRAVNEMEKRLGARIPVRSLVLDSVAAIALAAEAAIRRPATATTKPGGWLARVVRLLLP